MPSTAQRGRSASVRSTCRPREATRELRGALSVARWMRVGNQARRRRSHPLALSVPYVTVSRHTVPTGRLRVGGIPAPHTVGCGPATNSSPDGLRRSRACWEEVAARCSAPVSVASKPPRTGSARRNERTLPDPSPSHAPLANTRTRKAFTHDANAHPWIEAKTKRVGLGLTLWPLLVQGCGRASRRLCWRGRASSS